MKTDIPWFAELASYWDNHDYAEDELIIDEFHNTLYRLGITYIEYELNDGWISHPGGDGTYIAITGVTVTVNAIDGQTDTYEAEFLLP